MSEHLARQDFAAVWLEICRMSLAGIKPEPEQLFDESEDLADAVARHPAGGDAA